MNTKYLAAYWGKSNIRVNAIAPAGIYNDHKDPFYSNYVKKLCCKMGAPEDIANAIVYLSSEASKWVTELYFLLMEVIQLGKNNYLFLGK